MHGGAIGFASKAGVGSTFAFYVKSRNTVSRLECESDTTTSDPSLLERASCEKNQIPIRAVNNSVAAADLYVLIVEDNLVNQRVLAKQLRKLGINVAVVNHGGEALDHLHTTTYCIKDEPSAKELSIILMDWEMPVCASKHF